jgi:outer membrane protein
LPIDWCQAMKNILWLGFCLIGLLTQPAWALKLTDFLEFQQHMQGSPAKNMLVTQPDTTSTICADSLPEQPLALIDVVEQALCNNPRTSEVWATARAQTAQVGVQRANYLPKVTLVSGISKIHNEVTNSRFSFLDQDNRILNRAHSLRLTWLVADFGQRSAKMNQAEALLDAANALHDAALQEVFINAAQAYFDHLSTLAMLGSYQESEKVARESLAAAAAKFKAGVGLLTDQLQAQTAYSQARLDRTKAEGEVNNAHGALALAMGVVANTRFNVINRSDQLEKTDFVTTADQMIQEAIEFHPSIIAAKAKLRAAKENINAVSAEGLPTLSFNAEISRTDQLGQAQLAGVPASDVYTNNSTVGLQVNVPLFEGFARKHQVESADAESQVRASELKRVIQQVTLEVWKSYHALVSERENLRASEELVTNSREAFAVAQGRYNAGVGNIIELLNAQNAWANAKQQNIKSLSSWRTVRLKLAASMGRVGLWAITD